MLARSFTCAVLLLGMAATAGAQVLNLAWLNTVQVQALDRAHTVILIPDGIMEEHGPLLPSYTDGFVDEDITHELARRIAERPGWTAAIFPVVPLGAAPANIIGSRYTFPGSFTVRSSVVRDIYMDLADAFGNLGFRHIFVIDSHGGPPQSVALDAAADYFHDTYGGHMTHLLGTMRIFNCCRPLEETLSKQQVEENGLPVHADALETSMVQFLRPDLVPGSVATAKANGAADFPGLMAAAAEPDWPGYLGSPAYASAALGARAMHELNDAVAALAMEILDGKADPARLERYGNTFMALTPDIEKGALADEAKRTARHQAWMAKHSPDAQPR